MARCGESWGFPGMGNLCKKVGASFLWQAHCWVKFYEMAGARNVVARLVLNVTSANKRAAGVELVFGPGSDHVQIRCPWVRKTDGFWAPILAAYLSRKSGRLGAFADFGPVLTTTCVFRVGTMNLLHIRDFVCILLFHANFTILGDLSVCNRIRDGDL